MKKSLVFILILLFCVASSFAEEKKEMIVLFDTSVSVLPYFDFLSGRLIHDLIKEHLDEGDNFHLLSFDAEPHFEFTIGMNGTSEEDRIISYTSLLKPMGQYTDLISALNYLYKFTINLSLNSAKKILILTDGIHDPPPSSPLYGKSEKYIEDRIKDITEKIDREGWNIHIMEFPSISGYENADSADSKLTLLNQNILSNTDDQSNLEMISNTDDESNSNVLSNTDVNPNSNLLSNNDDESNLEVISNDKNIIGVLSDELDTPTVLLNMDSENISNIAMENIYLQIYDYPRETGYRLDLPVSLKNFGSRQVYAGINEVIWNNQNILSKKVSGKIGSQDQEDFILRLRIPAETETGDLKMEIHFVFTEGADVTPNSAVLDIFLTDNSEDRYNNDIPIGLIVGILLILIFIVIVILFIRNKIETPAVVSTNKREDQENNVLSSVISTSFLAEKDEVKTEKNNLARTSPSNKDEKHFPKQKSSGLEIESLYKDKQPVKQHIKTSGKEKISSIEHSIKDEEAHLAVEMHVVGQNPYKWSRNIEVIKSGHNVLVGNRHNDFSIFIIELPKNCAELSFDGKCYTFTPLLTEYFPDLNGPLKNCIETYIKVVDERGKQTRIIFRKWVSPLQKINRILHMIDKPGLPDFRY